MMPTSQVTSLSLLDRLKQSDNDLAWEMFLSIYRPFIRKQLLRCGIRNADVDDVLQEAISAMLVALPSFQHNGNVGAFRRWMKTIVTRKAGRVLNKTHQMKNAHQGLCEQTRQFDRSFDQMMEREHDIHVIQSLLRVIRPEFTRTTWTAFEMQVLDGKSASETAERLGRSINSALISKSRVMRRLRQFAKGLVEC